ncbi:MAG: hypothetical protein KDH95_13310 [Calditrichaeota bacterium]|nr:hypothetical protein [Calditrichota bacterium]MCB0269135.1 hypothetical protein [Calditrichota bacterium]
MNRKKPKTLSREDRAKRRKQRLIKLILSKLFISLLLGMFNGAVVDNIKIGFWSVLIFIATFTASYFIRNYIRVRLYLTAVLWGLVWGACMSGILTLNYYGRHGFRDDTIALAIIMLLGYSLMFVIDIYIGRHDYIKPDFQSYGEFYKSWFNYKYLKNK